MVKFAVLTRTNRPSIKSDGWEYMYVKVDRSEMVKR